MKTKVFVPYYNLIKTKNEKFNLTHEEEKFYAKIRIKFSNTPPPPRQPGKFVCRINNIFYLNFQYKGLNMFTNLKKILRQLLRIAYSYHCFPRYVYSCFNTFNVKITINNIIHHKFFFWNICFLTNWFKKGTHVRTYC